jgi:fatty-acyl-CoA synthase
MSRYWNNAKGSEEAIIDGWLRTGDLGVLDEDGNVTLLDRIKDIIISGGLNISPIDIESVIALHPGIAEVSVFGVPDERFGETPMAIVYANALTSSADIIALCNAKLADYKVPRYLIFLEEPLPRLATGKVAKRILKERYGMQLDGLTRVR